MAEKVIEYINEKLFTEEKPVVFTDLIFRFKVGPSKAKALMYAYYKQNTTTKFNCIIVCVARNGSVRVVHDVNNIEDQESLVDCFIYAFNPMEVFIPVSVARDQHDCLTIQNPYKLQVATKRSKTVEVEPSKKQAEIPVSRSKTVPEGREVSKKKPVKTKETGLRSTAILAKMRGERENKEKVRQEELRKRREEQHEQETKHDTQRSAQLQELNSMFDEEDEEGVTQDEEPATEEQEPTPEIPKSTPIDQDEIENLLETTAEDSLMNNNTKDNNAEPATPETKPDPDSSYVDDDGYTVTNRAATSTPPPARQPSKKRAQPASKTDIPVKKRAPKTKKTQGTLESFFKKK